MKQADSFDSDSAKNNEEIGHFVTIAICDNVLHQRNFYELNKKINTCEILELNKPLLFQILNTMIVTVKVIHTINFFS